jgi:hypothetical protein
VSGAEVCWDDHRNVLAYCRSVSGVLHVDVPDLASFTYERGANDVTAVPHGPLPATVIRETFHHCVLPLMLPALGTSVLHASAVADADGVTALCAPSGTGKSTLAVALARRGYSLFADDAVAIDTATTVPTAIPLPFTIRLRPESARFFGSSGRGDLRIAAGANGERRPLKRLCFLRRAAGAPVTVERLDPASACQAALGHACCFSATDPVQKRQTIESYLSIVARVPACEIRFRPGLEQLPAVLDAIAEILE